MYFVIHKQVVMYVPCEPRGGTRIFHRIKFKNLLCQKALIKLLNHLVRNV